MKTLQLPMSDSKQQIVIYWLLTVTATILVMAVVGAITRLTESGLSIMEWAPIKGTLPPFSETEWQRVFELYKTIPEYKWDNPDMTLAEFKTIFWWEWIHRLLGRVIGLAFAIPLLVFWLKGWLPQWLKKHLLIALVLGSLQGAMGWYMVASGFGNRTDVSQYRLALHLGLALVLFGYLLWLSLTLIYGKIDNIKLNTNSKLISFALLLLISITVISGAFVAGLNAGVIYNSFPLMGDQIIPSDYLTNQGFFTDIFENHATVQWNHRLFAISTLILVTVRFLTRESARNHNALNQAWTHLVIWVWIQLALGITTLLLVVPIWAGALHQAGATILLALGIRCFFFEILDLKRSESI